MLTKGDLDQIAKVIDTRLDAKIGPIIEENLKPIQKDIKALRSDVAGMRKTVDVLARQHDKELMRQRKQIQRVEKELHLPPLDEKATPSPL